MNDGFGSKVRNPCWIKRVGQPSEFKIHSNITGSSSTHPLPQVVLTFIQQGFLTFEPKPSFIRMILMAMLS